MNDAPHTGGWLLALDTATNTIVVAAGTPAGDVLASVAFEGRFRHSQELLPAVVRVLEDAGLRLADLGGIVVGTGPGAFTGLRVGLATAKTLAHELRRPVVGIASSDALLAGESDDAVLWLPSGARDRVAVRRGGVAEVIRAEAGAAAEPRAAQATGPGDERVVAVDLPDRASEAALARGQAALERLPASLLRLGAERLSRGESDDPERLVPRYASQPRGAPASEPEEGVAWSRDPR